MFVGVLNVVRCLKVHYTRTCVSLTRCHVNSVCWIVYTCCLSISMSRMPLPPPPRSNDGRPTSPAQIQRDISSNSIDEARNRSSSEATPKTRATGALTTDPFSTPTPPARRPNKPSLSSSSSAGVGGSENNFGAAGPNVPPSGQQHLGVRSGSRAEMYPARDTAASPAPSICKSPNSEG